MPLYDLRNLYMTWHVVHEQSFDVSNAWKELQTVLQELQDPSLSQ